MKSRRKNIQKQEENFDKISIFLEKFEAFAAEWENLSSVYQELIDYYQSPQWMKDYEDSEKEEFADLKSGVLSQDAIYNLIFEQRTLSFQIMRTALDYLEK